MEFQRIAKDATNLFAGRVGTTIIGAVNLMILTRLLTTADMGKYSLFLMVVNLAVTMGLTWSDTSIVRYGREEYVNHKKINQTFWARLYLFVPVMIFIIIAFFVFSGPITAYVGISRTWIIFLIVLFVLNGTLNFVSRTFQSIDQMKKSAYIQFFQKLIYLVGLALLFAGLFKTDLLIIWSFLSISFLLTLVVNVIMLDKSVIMPFRYNKEYFRKIWSYSWPQLMGFSGLYIINYIDLYVIRRYMTLGDVGVYSVSYNGFTIICTMIMILNTLFMPLIVEYRSSKRFDMIRDYLKKLPLFSGAWIVLVGIGILLSRYLIPFLFSSKYVDSIPSFNILLITSIFYFVSIYLLPIVNTFDYIIYSQVFNIAKSIVNIVGDFVFVPRYGIIGAAYGTLLAYAFGLACSAVLVYVKRKIILGISE